MLKSASIGILSKLISAFCGFYVMLLLTWYLSISDRGTCAFYLVIITINLAVCEVIAGASIGLLLKNYLVRNIKKVSYSWSAAISLMIPAAFYLFSRVNITEFYYLAIICFLNAGITTHQNILLGQNKLNTYYITQTAQPVLTVLFTYLFFSAADNAAGEQFLKALLFSWCLVFAGSAFVARQIHLVEDKLKTRALIKAGMSLGFRNQLGHLAGILNNRLIYLLIPATALGVFANAISIAEAMLIVPTILGQIIYSGLLNNRAHINEASVVTIQWLSIISLLAGTLVLAVLPDRFYVFIFRKELPLFKDYAVTLGLGLSFYAGFLIFSYWQSGFSRFILNFYALCTGLIFNILVSLFLLAFNRYDVLTGVRVLSMSFLVVYITSILQFLHTENTSFRVLLSHLSLKKAIKTLLK
ncbi:MATE family efflux transporter [Polluticaenibacter yanchengensis]|uniref:Polysaccharide biosynthesis protein n=1 Tax=Polluticaenibacter yanchengensis TaxID=3014562 RepID=A0ABT4ULZ0_9BACT|nr:hypothetical protein [Chitinophagaceae bacterium LY-5]